MTQSQFLREEPVHIRMYMVQEEKLPSPRDHHYAAVDITLTQPLLVQ